MPFGPKCEYADFNDCVRKNQGMDSPEGYCARIQQATEQHCRQKGQSKGMSRHTDAINTYKHRLFDRLANLNPAMAEELRGLRLDWYRVGNKAEDSDPDVTDVFIYDEIGGSFGVSADEFVKELNDITTPRIDVRINSPGGSLFDSIAIYNALVKHRAYVTTYVDSLAASGASIICMAGDERVMMLGSQLMIHDALGVEMGNAKDMEAMAKFLDRQSVNIASVYSGRAGGTIAEWRDRMLAETWMFAAEAVEMGLADKVYKAAEDDDDDDSKTDNPPDHDDDHHDDMDVHALMHRPHQLTNFKYAGREHAPTPKRHLTNARSGRSRTTTIDPLDEMLDTLTAALGKGRSWE